MTLLHVVEVLTDGTLFHISAWATAKRARRAAAQALLQLREQSEGNPVAYRLEFRTEDLDN